MDETRIIKKISKVGIFGNVALAGFKLLAGIFGNSGAIEMFNQNIKRRTQLCYQ